MMTTRASDSAHSGSGGKARGLKLKAWAKLDGDRRGGGGTRSQVRLEKKRAFLGDPDGQDEAAFATVTGRMLGLPQRGQTFGC